MPPKRAKQLA